MDATVRGMLCGVESSEVSSSDQGKDMREGHSPHKTPAPDPVGSATHQSTSWWGRADKAKADQQHRCRDLYRCLNVELWLDCQGDLDREAAR